jgi:hypothetical protein
MPVILEGTRPNAYDYGGHPAPSGRALPNLINAVKMLKSKSKSKSKPQNGVVFVGANCVRPPLTLTS